MNQELPHPEAPPPPSARSGAPPDPEPQPRGFWAKRLEKMARKKGPELLQKFRRRERRGSGFRGVPDQIHRLARQLSLSIELVDDFRSGEYRALPWSAVVIIAGSLLYAVSPADVIPDALLGIGSLDDAIVLALATRLVRRHLHEYCRFKGYDPANYFGPLPFKEKHRAPSIEPSLRPSETVLAASP